MGVLDELLEKVKKIPPGERALLDRDTLADGLRWIPNPGAQTDAYRCKADELFYGGSAGGGKTDLILGLSVNEHTSSLVLRKFIKDSLDMADRMLDGIIQSRDGWNGTLHTWKSRARTVDFGGCQTEDDKQRFKGVPHDLICVGVGTPVLLADGSYCNVEDLRVGQMLQTLEGPRRLERVYPRQRKQCVEVVARDSNGVVVGRQIQSTSHALLLGDGQFAVCEPTQRRGIDSRRLLSAPRSSFLSRSRELISSYCAHTEELLSTWLGRQCDEVMRVFDRQLGSGSGCVEFGDEHAGASQPLLSFARLVQLRPSFHSDVRVGHPPVYGCGVNDVLTSSIQRGSSGRCSSDIRRRDERIRQSSGSLSGAAGALRCLLLRDDVAQPNPNHLLEGAPVGTRIRSRLPRMYAHPYTKERRRASVSGSLLCAALEVSPIGERDVYDLQVEEVRHYITKGGFINKNCFDEISDFSESQFRFIATWNRTTKPGQRCRVVCTGNPPTNAEGLWVIQYWGPWLDPTHPNPARDGELRWYTTGEDGRDMEVDGPGPHMIGGRPTVARSRTFIRGWLSDNPDLAVTNYDAVLSALPERERAAYRDGRFDASIRENPEQVIPTAWVRAAQARWTPTPPDGVPMCAIGADIAQGGSDNNVIAVRHDGWYAPLIVIPGVETPLGTDIAGTLIAKRRDRCPIIIDCGGGYGGPVYKHLRDNIEEEKVVSYKGAEASHARTKDQTLRFYNKRAEVLWRFREALDPDQPQGSTIALPPDTVLLSDLVATTYSTSSGCIKLETTELLNKRIGRSIDRGVAVVLAWSAGNKIADSYNQWRQPRTRSVLRSHQSARRRV